MVLLILVIAIYAATLGAPVVSDDIIYVWDNAIFRLPFGAFWRVLAGLNYFEFAQERTYQPLVTLFHYFTCNDPAIYRLTGILLHAFNGFLVFLLGRKLTGSGKAALAAAVLFILFPTHTETVNYSAFKGHLFAFAFGVSGFLLWIRALESPKPLHPFLACCALYCLALLSKETGVLMLGLAAFYGLSMGSHEKARAVKLGALLLAPTAVYLLFRFKLLTPPPPEFHGTADPAAVFGWYLRLLAFPQPLCFERTFASVWWEYALSAAFAVLFWLSRHRPAARFGLFWIVWGLLPYLQFIPFSNYSAPGFVLVADRYLYWSAAGLCLALGQLLSEHEYRYVLGAALIFFGASSLRRNLLYLDEKAFLEQTVACAPRHPRAWANLGKYFLQRNRFELAQEATGKAITLDPNFVGALNDMGLISVHLSRPVEAQEYFERSLRVTETALVHVNLGNVLDAQGKDGEALAQYRRASEMSPQWPVPYANAALILGKTDPKKAGAFRRTAELKASESAGQ